MLTSPPTIAGINVPAGPQVAGGEVTGDGIDTTVGPSVDSSI